MFGRSVHELSLINNTFLNFMYTRWSHLLQTMNQPWLSTLNLELYADKIHSKGAALNNFWGFVDGTVRPVCRPGSNQRILYNGHKRVHSIKFQAASAPNGLCAHLSGPFEGKKHDSSMLHDSGPLPQLEQHSFNGNGDILCIYGDPACPVRPHLLGPFGNLNLTVDQKAWNQSMSSVRVSQGGHSFSQLEFQDISRISRTFLTIFPGQFGMGIEFFA